MGMSRLDGSVIGETREEWIIERNRVREACLDAICQVMVMLILT